MYTFTVVITHLPLFMKKLFTVALLLSIAVNTYAQVHTDPITGNVGIGTQFPYQKLHVTDADLTYIMITSTNYTINPVSLTKKGGIIFHQNNVDKTAGISFAIPPGYHVPGIVFSTKEAYSIPGNGMTDWYDRMFIHPNGNVGIGTTDPKSKLAVNGQILATKVKVTQQNWPDYVFADDYLLPSLDSLQGYITNHRRLPGIPSATEVEKEGLDVGEMHKQLLEKVEQLTLYLLKEHAEKEQLKKDVEALKKKLESKP